MKQMIFGFLILTFGLATAHACDGKPLTHSEYIVAKNKATEAALSKVFVPLDLVVDYTYNDDFFITRGVKGNCDAVVVGGSASFSVGSECSLEVQYSYAADKQDMEVTYQCL